MRVRRFLVFFLFFSLHVFSQKNVFEFSLAGVRDKNLNLSPPHAFSFEDIPDIDNRYAMGIAVAYERKNTSPFSFIVTVRDVLRKIDYIKANTVITGFIQNTLEIPIGARYSKAFSDQYKFRVDLSPGINYVLTKDESTLYEGDATQESSIQFVKNKKPCYFVQFSIGLESKLNSKSALIIFMAYQYQVSSLYNIRINNSFIDRDPSPVYPSYYSFGMAYRFFGK